MPASLATWEPLEYIKQQFPRAPAWGQAASQDGGNVDPQDQFLSDEGSAEPGKRHLVEARPKRSARPSIRIAGPEWEL
jgi:hypothetical protein